tara:strand:+ start:12001 stop:13809 length:1809 start_codon:yes stop_codon:yes gene_type:complete
MPNWKNRPMMMKSGGSVNKETLIDLAKRLQEERVDFGPLYSNKKSRGARFGVRDGILDLIQDRESGKKSLKYSRGPASLEAYTDDPYAGSGVKGNITLRFNKGGEVKSFVPGVNPFDLQDKTIYIDPFTRDKAEFQFMNDRQINAIINTQQRKQREKERRDAINKKKYSMQRSADPININTIVNTNNALRNLNSRLPQKREEAKEFLNNTAVETVMERFGGNFDDFAEYLNSENITENDSKLFSSIDLGTVESNLEEIQNNIAQSREGTEKPKEISTKAEEVTSEESGQGDGQSDQETETPPEQQAKEKTDFQLFADEIAIRDEGSYSPEAQRAGQVASMYGQVSPGQVGGFGVAEARGAAAAEATQQKIEADEREIGGALAKKRMELAAAPKYGDIGKIDLGPLGDKDMTAQVYKSKNPGTGAGQYGSLFVEGSADAVVGEAFTRAAVLNRQLQAMQYLFDNAEKITGGPKKVVALAESLGGLFGLNPPAGGFTDAKAAVQFLQLELAKELLGEGGKTISDTEREMVRKALGEPGATTTPAQLKARISKVIEKLQGNTAQVRRFLDQNAKAHPAIAKALQDANARLSAKNNIVPKTAYMGK